jgi:hypothetical protein
LKFKIDGVFVRNTILAALSTYFCFTLPQKAAEKLARGFVVIIISAFGVESFVIVTQVLTVFVVCLTRDESYKLIGPL